MKKFFWIQFAVMPQCRYCSSQSDPSRTTSLFEGEKMTKTHKCLSMQHYFSSLSHCISYWLQKVSAAELCCKSAVNLLLMPGLAKRILNWKALIKISPRMLLFSKCWCSLNLNQTLDLRDLIILNIGVRLFDCGPWRVRLIHRTLMRTHWTCSDLLTCTVALKPHLDKIVHRWEDYCWSQKSGHKRANPNSSFNPQSYPSVWKLHAPAKCKCSRRQTEGQV